MMKGEEERKKFGGEMGGGVFVTGVVDLVKGIGEDFDGAAELLGAEVGVQGE